MAQRISLPPRFALLCCLLLAGCSKSTRMTAPSVDPGGPEIGAAADHLQERSPVAALSFTPGSSNPYFPLVVGTEFDYRSKTKDGTETETFTVTNDTKVIQGTTVRVIQDDVWLDGVLIEHTFDWFAQDQDGNVWYFGEDATNIDPVTGAIDHDGSWESGKNGASAGIIMLAHPAVGDSYDEEHAPGVGEDHAEVVSIDERVNVPAGHFADCLQTKNTTPLEPDVVEGKEYAPGVGLVREIDFSGRDKNVLLSVSGPGAPPPKRDNKDNKEEDDGPGTPRRWIAE